MSSLSARVIEEARSRFDLHDVRLCWNAERAHADGSSDLTGCYPVEDLEGADVRRVSLFSAANGMHAEIAWRETTAQVRSADAWEEFLRDLALVSERVLQRESLAHSVRRLERAEHVQRALFAIANMASSDLDMPDMLHGIHEIVGWLMYAENFFIALYEPERDSLRFLYFVDSVDKDSFSLNDEIAASDLPNSLTLAMIRSGESQMGPSERVRTTLGVAKDPTLGPESEDWLGVPMIGAAAAIRGAIVVQSYLPDTRYSEEDRAILNYVAQHILTALERKQAQTELESRVVDRTRELAAAIGELQQEVAERQRGERLQRALFGIVECAAAAESMADFYASVHGIVGGLLNARNFYIALVEDATGELEFPYSVDEINPVRPRRPLAKGMTEYVLRTGQALLADRAKIDELVAADEVQRFGTRAAYWLGVPLVCADVAAGVLAVQSYSSETPFTARDQELLTFVAYHIANGLERKRAQESLVHDNVRLEARVNERTRELALANRDLTGQIRERERIEARLTHEAFHDALTGLPNRALLLQRLETAMQHFQKDPARRYAVLFLDLDRFKVVNDSVGHLIGDEMLKQAALRLAGACAPFLVARLGGDEFAVLIDSLPDPSLAATVAQRLIDVFNDPIRLSKKEMFTSASVGIAYSDEHYTRAEELLRDADTAMYRAKARGRQRYEIFDENLRAEAMRALDLEGDLRHALTRREFEPYFQTIVSLSDGRILGYEALLRWNHPTRGLLAPNDFLAAAEDSGCIEQIDWQIFTAACEYAHRLPESTYVSINVSARRLRVPDFDEFALRTIESCGLSPHRVRLEITEGALLDQPEQMREILLRLRKAGVLVQLDDFGTGYSSLSYLHRFPIHSLKIDRSFIADLGAESSSAAVVNAILALADSLDVEVIGEGIETPAQRDALIEMGCTVGQGYLFSYPSPINQLG
ncbi:MAG TPA: EAL domain-containing protein [Dokdonella sp.]|uniref:putative bifunctional diguanylate cyclase/phosphodiesterase n=1 Tax=Dokdonella sp. TaxID=2291710 RepID=UPI002D7F015D|nr:EAL domain-containing protein [Dokdonella sp.]HET9032750.1 EAL domain-containing protein [Dokdonella sp.]